MEILIVDDVFIFAIKKEVPDLLKCHQKHPKKKAMLYGRGLKL